MVCVCHLNLDRYSVTGSPQTWRNDTLPIRSREHFSTIIIYKLTSLHSNPIIPPCEGRSASRIDSARVVPNGNRHHLTMCFNAAPLFKKKTKLRLALKGPGIWNLLEMHLSASVLGLLKNSTLSWRFPVSCMAFCAFPISTKHKSDSCCDVATRLTKARP